jgi:peptidyl-prolyl cis-trans isomerase A (cyclophilin A)
MTQLKFTIRRALPMVAVAAFALPVWAQTAKPKADPASASAKAPATNPKVLLTTSMGNITLELDAAAAPKTVANMLQYVKDKHYDGTVFHRVIPGFMIQGGGMSADMVERKTRPPVEHEGQTSMAKGWKNLKYTVAMARTSDPNSATGQFFINTVDNAFLDPAVLPDGDPVTFNYRGQTVSAPRSHALAATAGYTVFGKVIAGQDVVEKIKAVPTGNRGQHQNVPTEPVTIIKATLEK